MIHNYMETLVDEMLRDELADNAYKYTGLCQCPACLAHIKAVALNSLPPFYTTGTTGQVFGEYQSRESQNLSDIMAAIGKGVAEVERLPPHSWPPEQI